MNRDQLRASKAFEMAAAVPVGHKRDFLSLAQKFPAMLQINGFLASVAFCLCNRESAANRIVLDGLLEHLRSCRLEPPGKPDPEHLFLTKWTQDATTGRQLQRLTGEAIRFSIWVKRAAEAVCDIDGNGGADTAARETEL